ncbi:MAG: zinc ribbon domain-containing protein [Clostridia bacterium]|nr:zinc ribbon domain-containing protein [Clostridia bacterium]
MAYCGKCGAALSDGSAFCSQCGAPVNQNTNVRPDLPNDGTNCIFRCNSNHPSSYVKIQVPGLEPIVLQAGFEMKMTLPVGIHSTKFGVHRGHGFTLVSSSNKYVKNIPIEPNKVLYVTVSIGRTSNNIEMKAF